MKRTLFFLPMLMLSLAGFCQEQKNDKILAELSVVVCKCIDSIDSYNKSKQEIATGIRDCIDKSAGAYLLSMKLQAIDSLAKNAPEKDGKKQVNISLNLDKESDDYKQAYYKIERYLMANCAAIKTKAAADDKQRANSLSDNPLATNYYNKGIDATKAGDLKKALEYYQKAVGVDSLFAFAWDNIGLTYRKLGEYDKALAAYKTSLAIDPKGVTPLQNMAVVYQYQGENQKAIDTYKKLSEIDSTNAEIYYGIGQVNAMKLKDYENGLDNMCKAYHLYIQQNSPYRTDAEKIIQLIYQEMKAAGKEEKFDAILKENHISTK